MNEIDELNRQLTREGIFLEEERRQTFLAVEREHAVRKQLAACEARWHRAITHDGSLEQERMG